MPQYLAIDTETVRIDYHNPVPELICFQSAVAGETKGSIVVPWEEAIDKGFVKNITDGTHLILHNGSFDMSVLLWKYPHLLQTIFDAYDAGLIHDTLLREKLLNITRHGNLEMLEVNGAMMRIGYAQKDLERKYLNIDRSDLKDDDDSPRLNYNIYKNVPLNQWRKEFISYAIDDAVNCGQIFWKQEQERQKCIEETGYDPFATEAFRTRVAWGLRLIECVGSLLDGDKVKEVSEFFTKEYMKPSLRDPLIAAGLLLPEVSPMPYANGAVEHKEGCTNRKKGGCSCPPKMKAAEAEKSPRRPLFRYIWNLARTQPDLFKAWPADACISKLKQEGVYDLAISDGAFKLSILQDSPDLPDDITLTVGVEWMANFAALDPLLSILDDRNKVKKIVTDYLPKMYYTDPLTGVSEPAKIIRGAYNPLVMTGRSSSYAGKLYPSRNDQNVDPRVRPCTIPREGNVICSTDYSGMELGTLAQKCLQLFGYSELANKINAGIDVHAYLAAQIAFNMDNQFALLAPNARTADERYDFFNQTKNLIESCEQFLPAFCAVYRHEHPDHPADKPVTWADFFKHYRTMAKPTGLGYPGGLGAATFIAYAKATYGLHLTLETAKQLKELWLETYPEMKQYLDYIGKQIDPHHSVETYLDDDGKTQKRVFYYYDTPRGMHRPKCSFCECANGMGLQSFSAEGALEALYRVQKATWLAEPGSLLYGVMVIAFIHDEILWESPDDGLLGQRARAIEGIMIEAMAELTPDVKAGAETAAMYRWDKSAKSLWEGDKLVVWEPDEKKP
jgi:DNA polymerase-1